MIDSSGSDSEMQRFESCRPSQPVSSPAPNSCWSHKPRVPRHSRGPVSVSIHGMQTFDADIGSCLQGLFSTHGFAVAAKRGALARITFVASANVTHPVLAPVATEEESAAGWNDRPRIAALSTCQWQKNARRSFLVLHDAVDAPAAIVPFGLDGEAALLLEREAQRSTRRSEGIVRLPHPKEPGPTPLRSRDGAGDAGKAAVGAPVPEKSIGHHGHLMSSALPFAHQDGPGPGELRRLAVALVRSAVGTGAVLPTRPARSRGRPIEQPVKLAR